jgi:mono/diheme cytochrome c family protein
MRWTRGILAATALLPLLAAHPAAAQTSDGEPLTILDGVYTEEQAERGAEVIEQVCRECHEDEEFVGAFIRSWAGASVAALYDDIYSLMPEDQPGSLPPQQYADVIAYILQLNGLPPGDVELATARDVLERVIIESRR